MPAGRRATIHRLFPEPKPAAAGATVMTVTFLEAARDGAPIGRGDQPKERRLIQPRCRSRQRAMRVIFDPSRVRLYISPF